jgi:uncharacterized linocin/CFP29 family protein
MANGEIGWTEATWTAINDDVRREASRIRIGQKVFPTSILDGDPAQIPDERINVAVLRIPEGETKPLTEIFVEFPLTVTQVAREVDEHTAATLARMAAKQIALGEDAFVFQQSPAAMGAGGVVPVIGVPNPQVQINIRAVDVGLLGEAGNAPAMQIPVPRLPAGGGAAAAAARPLWGANTFTAVSNGIAQLIANAQGPPFALILPTAAYADTYVPPSKESLVCTADRIKPLVEGGFYTCGVLPSNPNNEGLLVALAGEPVRLFVGREASCEYVRKAGKDCVFRVVERVQYVVRDPRALVLLQFA